MEVSQMIAVGTGVRGGTEKDTHLMSRSAGICQSPLGLYSPFGSLGFGTTTAAHTLDPVISTSHRQEPSRSSEQMLEQMRWPGRVSLHTAVFCIGQGLAPVKPTPYVIASSRLLLKLEIFRLQDVPLQVVLDKALLGPFLWDEYLKGSAGNILGVILRCSRPSLFPSFSNRMKLRI